VSVWRWTDVGLVLRCSLCIWLQILKVSESKNISVTCDGLPSCDEGSYLVDRRLALVDLSVELRHLFQPNKKMDASTNHTKLTKFSREAILPERGYYSVNLELS
jgi:hypothetical protein